MKYKIMCHQAGENGYYHLKIAAPEIAKKTEPGQFLMIRISDSTHDPLLRRPISIMNVTDQGHIEMLYKVAGRGTRLLTTAPAGSYLDVVGPLGHGYQLPEKPYTALLVGGGIGIPPLVYLADELTRSAAEKTIAFLGARTSADLPLIDRFDALGVSVQLATENGEKGTEGLVTQPLLEMLKNWLEPTPPVIYACGPDPMLRALQGIAREFQIPAQLSLEEHMGCGVGACLGCIVDTANGYQRVCYDGPVFDAEILKKWD